jgi:hypothetical protein
MFNPWITFSFQAIRLGWEAQNVIALRLLRLAGGGARAQAEASRMVTEKIATGANAQTAAVSSAIKGASAPKIATNALKVYKKRLRANKRRLSK